MNIIIAGKQQGNKRGDERISENNQGKLCELYRKMEGRNLIYKWE